MHRTQIYITKEQDARITQRAADAGVSKAEVIRRMLDEGLGIEDGAKIRRSAIEATAGLLHDAPDWREWLSDVRGSGADARLKSLRA